MRHISTAVLRISVGMSLRLLEF